MVNKKKVLSWFDWFKTPLWHQLAQLKCQIFSVQPDLAEEGSLLGAFRQDNMQCCGMRKQYTINKLQILHKPLLKL